MATRAAAVTASAAVERVLPLPTAGQATRVGAEGPAAALPPIAGGEMAAQRQTAERWTSGGGRSGASGATAWSANGHAAAAARKRAGGMPGGTSGVVAPRGGGAAGTTVGATDQTRATAAGAEAAVRMPSKDACAALSAPAA